MRTFVNTANFVGKKRKKKTLWRSNMLWHLTEAEGRSGMINCLEKTKEVSFDMPHSNCLLKGKMFGAKNRTGGTVLRPFWPDSSRIAWKQSLAVTLGLFSVTCRKNKCKLKQCKWESVLSSWKRNNHILTMPSRGRLSLIAPQHPRKPMTITNAPAAIKILAGREYPLLPRNASNCPGSISVHIPIPKMAAPASWKKDYKLEFWVYLSCHVCLHWFCRTSHRCTNILLSSQEN